MRTDALSANPATPSCWAKAKEYLPAARGGVFFTCALGSGFFPLPTFARGALFLASAYLFSMEYLKWAEKKDHIAGTPPPPLATRNCLHFAAGALVCAGFGSLAWLAFSSGDAGLRVLGILTIFTGNCAAFAATFPEKCARRICHRGTSAEAVRLTESDT